MIVGQATATRSPMSGGPFIPLFVITIALTLTTLGLVMLFSAGAVTKSGPYALVSKQAIWLGLSIVAGGVSAFVNLELLRKRAWLLYGICALALVLVLVPGFGVKVNGAQRWLGLGPLRLQPSEFAKIGLVLILAVYLSANQREIKSLCRGFVYPSLILGLVLGLIMLQPDFGTTFLCGAVGATMMFLAGVSLRWLLPIAGLAVSGFALLVYLDPVRIRRVTSFLDVEANANDSAYQLWQGMLAFGVGGVDGVGLGKGRQQMHFLPEAHTDFIFSVIGEELGLIFSLGIVACFLALFVLVAWRLREAPNLYLFLIGSGAILAIALQAVINVGVVTGSMPTKGMSLPFISYGGSNLMVTFVLIGLILNVFRNWGGPVLPRSREL